MTLDIATSLESPVVRTVLGVIAAGLLYTLGKELRKIPAKLTVLMATAFLDMVGLLIVVPILYTLLVREKRKRHHRHRHHDHAHDHEQAGGTHPQNGDTNGVNPASDH